MLLEFWRSDRARVKYSEDTLMVYVRCFWNSGAVIELELNIPKTPSWFRTKVENILKETFIFHCILFDITQFVDTANCLQTVKSRYSFPATMRISLLALSSARYILGHV